MAESMMRIGYIPGALDLLSGEYFPHLVHMRENIKALRRKVVINILTADEANRMYMRYQNSRFYEMVNHRSLHFVRKLIHLMFFIVVYAETRKKIGQQQNDVFIVRFSFSNYLISRYLHSEGQKILSEVHALAHIEEKKHGQGYAPPFYFLIVRYLEKKMLGWADQITTVTQALKDSLVELGIEKKKIHVIQNAVDPEKFNYLSDPKDIIRQHNLEDKIVIGFVGSFARYHGLGVLLDIAKRLEGKYRDICFLMVGRNFHGSENPIEAVSKRGLSHLFTFTGEMPHSRIPLYIAAMDIAMIPDSNTYGSPMKLFEYMAMKRPVVAAGVPPLREVVEDWQTAVLFERGNVVEALKALEELIENEQLRGELGERAYAKAIGSYTWDQNVQKIIQIAKQMLSY